MLHAPLFTCGAFVVCFVVLCVTIGFNISDENPYGFEDPAKNPLLGPSEETLVRFTVKETPSIWIYLSLDSLRLLASVSYSVGGGFCTKT